MITLIKNGLVYDGSDVGPKKTDILVNGNTITQLGTFGKEHADTVIDVTNAIVTPGFVDIENEADHYLQLLTAPELPDYIRQGVTTVICGNCGASLAPLLDGSLEAIRKWGDPSSVNVDWQSTTDFLHMLEKKGVGVNFGTLVGHSTLRRALTKDDFRDLTDGELEIMKHTLSRALREGAFGLSTGLSYVHVRRTPTYELRELAKIVALSGGVYATHLRNAEDKLSDSINETLELAKQTNANIEINHLQPLKDFTESYGRALESIEMEAAESNVHFDVYPFDTVAFPIYTFLPEWIQDGGLEKMFVHLAAGESETRLLEYFLRFTSRDITICHITQPSLKFLEGKTLKSFAESHNVPLNRALLYLMRLTRLRAVVFYRNVDAKMLEIYLAHPNSIIASGGTSLLRQTVFPAYLKHVAEQRTVPFERAIMKITDQPARKFSLKRRGLIKEGYYADLVVMRDNIPTHVFVNGTLAFKDGVLAHTRTGKVLRSTD